MYSKDNQKVETTLEEEGDQEEPKTKQNQSKERLRRSNQGTEMKGSQVP
jgi:hypothetical protein